jgi:hypothetical protein
MDCREFREYHTEFLDGKLDMGVQDGAHLHLAMCERCASHDAAVRRALLVFRNLTPIEPSRHFSRRLNHRLAQERRGSTFDSRLFPAMLGAIALASAVVAGVVVTERGRMDPGVASNDVPALVVETRGAMSELVTPAIAASMSAGFPVWPSLVMIERAQKQLADAELRFVTYTAPR